MATSKINNNGGEIVYNRLSTAIADLNNISIKQEVMILKVTPSTQNTPFSGGMFGWCIHFGTDNNAVQLLMRVGDSSIYRRDMASNTWSIWHVIPHPIS